MSTLSRYLGREIYVASGFVFLAFLALFAFFDLINELGDLGRGQYRLFQVLLFVVLSISSHVYELSPVAVLIGTLYALSCLAGNSEYTAMRSAGLSPLNAASSLFRVGIVFALATFLLGEFIVPASEREARQLKLKAMNGVIAQEFRTGFWVKEDRRFLNVRELLSDARIAGLRVFEFDQAYRLVSISEANSAEFVGNGRWVLRDVTRTLFGNDGVRVASEPREELQSVLNPQILSVLFVLPERMSVWNLYQYVKHLSENRQNAERYEIAMWKKITYPLAVLVMMALALPFAYIHVRSGGVGIKVFAGIMIGVFFHMLNSLVSHLGLLQNWPPLSSAALPSAAFFAAAAAMMWWVERR